DGVSVSCARDGRLTAPARATGGGGAGEPAADDVDVSDAGVNMYRHLGWGTGDCLRARVRGKLIRRAQAADATTACTHLINSQARVRTAGRSHDAGEGPDALLWRRDIL